MGGGVRFGGMFEGPEDEVPHVTVGKCVVDVLALPTAAHDALGQQHAQLLREGRQLGATGLGQQRDALFSGAQSIGEPQACGIPQSLEEGRSILEGGFGKQGGFFGQHFNNYRTIEGSVKSESRLTGASLASALPSGRHPRSLTGLWAWVGLTQASRPLMTRINFSGASSAT